MKMTKYLFPLCGAIALALLGCTEKEILVLPELTDVPDYEPVSGEKYSPVIDQTEWDVFDEMPIIAWRGVPRDHVTVENYQNMKDCGFNVNLSYYNGTSLAEEEPYLQDALDMAEYMGMKIIAYWPRGFFNNAPTYVPKYDGREGLGGYVVEDEPDTYSQLESTLVNRKQPIMDAGAKKLCYVNLVGYARDWNHIALGLNSYTEYMETFLDYLGLPIYSFDHYGISTENGEIYLSGKYYENYEIAREISLKSGRPFWSFVLSCPHGSHPEPTVGQFRFQINVALAYGTQALQYYEYWLPTDVPTSSNYHNAPVDSEGNKTDTWYMLQEANMELLEVAPYFYRGRITKVVHFDDEFEGVTINSSVLGAIGSLLTTAAGEEYISVVNKSFEDPMSITYRGETYELKEGQLKLLPR